MSIDKLQSSFTDLETLKNEISALRVQIRTNNDAILSISRSKGSKDIQASSEGVIERANEDLRTFEKLEDANDRLDFFKHFADYAKINMTSEKQEIDEKRTEISETQKSIHRERAEIDLISGKIRQLETMIVQRKTQIEIQSQLNDEDKEELLKQKEMLESATEKSQRQNQQIQKLGDRIKEMRANLEQFKEELQDLLDVKDDLEGRVENERRNIG